MLQQNQKTFSVIGLGIITKKVIINNVYIGKYKMLNPLWMICTEEDDQLRNVCEPSFIKPVTDMFNWNEDLNESDMYECDCDECDFRLEHGFRMLDNEVKSTVETAMRNMLNDLSYNDVCTFERRLLPALFKVSHYNYEHKIKNNEDYLWSMINKWLFCDRRQDQSALSEDKKSKVERLKESLVSMAKSFCLLGHLEASDILMYNYETQVYDIDKRTFQVRKKR